MPVSNTQVPVSELLLWKQKRITMIGLVETNGVRAAAIENKSTPSRIQQTSGINRIMVYYTV